MIILEFCDVPDIPVFIDFGLGWAFLEPFKIGLIWGSSNMENQGEMGFSGISRGVVGGFFRTLFLVDFWYLVVSLLSFTAGTYVCCSNIMDHGMLGACDKDKSCLLP